MQAIRMWYVLAPRVVHSQQTRLLVMVLVHKAKVQRAQGVIFSWKPAGALSGGWHPYNASADRIHLICYKVRTIRQILKASQPENSS